MKNLYVNELPSQHISRKKANVTCLIFTGLVVAFPLINSTHIFSLCYDDTEIPRVYIPSFQVWWSCFFMNIGNKIKPEWNLVSNTFHLLRRQETVMKRENDLHKSKWGQLPLSSASITSYSLRPFLFLFHWNIFQAIFALFGIFEPHLFQWGL